MVGPRGNPSKSRAAPVKQVRARPPRGTFERIGFMVAHIAMRDDHWPICFFMSNMEMHGVPLLCYAGAMSIERIEQLTEAQRECLRLVGTMHSSKEIAVKLGVSPSAVDKRLERAVQSLGVGTRFAAARLLAENEAPVVSERLASEPFDVTSEDQSVLAPRPRGLWRIANSVVGLGDDASTVGPRNRLTRAQRVAAILGLVLALSLSMMILLNIAQTLSTLIANYRR